MMKHSESIAAIAKALASAQADYVPVPKNKTAKVKMKSGGEFSYNYADLADCLSMAIPRLAKHGIAFTQPHTFIDGKLRVVTFLLHESGEWLESDGIEISEDGDPQQFGAESTYFRRYDGCSFIGVAPDEDTDAQQVGNRIRRTTPAQAMAPQNSSAPSEKVFPPSTASQTKQPTQSPTQPPAASQGASQERIGPTKRIPPTPPDNVPGLVCTVKAIEERPKKGTVNASIRVMLDEVLTGKNQGVTWVCAWLTCWHAHLFEAIRQSVGKECQFTIKEADKKAKTTDEWPTHYVGIEDIVSVANPATGEYVEYQEGKPVNPAQQ
jgi:hypothetical protein